MPNANSAANVQGCRKEADMNNKITILYERLSVDDERNGESNSISNQKQLLEEYAERNGFTPYIHLSDDGYSGTNFNRPGWQELIAKIETDEVSALIIKDSSRMGRDYLRVGLYREMFREKGIRLIAVNDGVDTANGEDDFTPFREIMSEWYARDTSKKIKSVITAKGNSGKPTANTPPYGYIKDPNDKNKWLVDPEAAEVVKRIFNMTVDGMGPRTIAGKLCSEKIERPSYYLAQRGIGRYKSTCDNEHKYSWNYSTIVQILRKAEYAGHTVNFKGETPNFKSKKYSFKPKDEWVIFENTHGAIVSQETWELVQKLRETVRRTDNLGEANPLTGLLFCADCGAKMFNHRRSTPTLSSQDFYQCSAWKLSYAKFNEKCSAHHINTTAVREIILEVIRGTSGYVREHEAEFVEKIREMSAVKEREAAKAHTKAIAKNERRMAELDKIFRSLYEDKALGKIDEARFDEMIAGYEREREEITAKTATLQAELDEWSTDSMKSDKFIEIAKRYTEFNELTPAIINEFVDKIVVYEAEWSEGRWEKSGRGKGTRTQKVDVHLKYVGKFDVPDLRTPEEIEAERIRQERIDHERKIKRESRRRCVMGYDESGEPNSVA